MKEKLYTNESLYPDLVTTSAKCGQSRKKVPLLRKLSGIETGRARLHTDDMYQMFLKSGIHVQIKDHLHEKSQHLALRYILKILSKDDSYSHLAREYLDKIIRDLPLDTADPELYVDEVCAGLANCFWKYRNDNKADRVALPFRIMRLVDLWKQTLTLMTFNYDSFNL